MPPEASVPPGSAADGGWLDADTLGPDPLTALARWLEDARRAGEPEPEAMALATVGAGADPQVRMVLLKQVGPEGLIFFSNYASDKGRQLLSSPQAAVVCYWPRLHRQVRCTGPVARTSRAESRAYFDSRPHGARVSAAVSPQSRPIPGRAWIEARSAAYAARHPERVPLPRDWGGYRLRPDRIEFWLGRQDRLHDRIRFSAVRAGPWTVERLAP